MSASAGARQFRIGRSTATRWAMQWRRDGRRTARPMGGDRRSRRLEAWASTILDWIKETPDLTLREMQARLADRGVTTGSGTLCNLLQRHGLTYKKRQAMLLNRNAKM